MISQRIVRYALSQASVSRLGLEHQVKRYPNFLTPASSLRIGQSKTASTTTSSNTPYSSPNPSSTILAHQRLNRPVSPHLSIYQPQTTWCLSILHRITGTILSSGLYVFAGAYLAAPIFGWQLDSGSLAVAFGALPAAWKVLLKGMIALPFAFHGVNGVRHLVWDTGRMLMDRQVRRSGWMVVGLSVGCAVVLAFV